MPGRHAARRADASRRRRSRSELRGGRSASCEQALPGARIAGYGSTGNTAFVSKDGRTAFVVAYPPPDPDQPFGDNPKAARSSDAPRSKGATVAGAPVHLTGYDALSTQSGGGNGPGVLLEALLGGLGALLVLAFVFGSLLAFVPILMAIASILTTFLRRLGPDARSPTSRRSCSS